MNKYEPLDYDAPNEPSSLLVFTNDSDYMSPHFSLNNNWSTLSLFNHSSTSSNASGANENNNTYLDNLRCSRPSSVASNYPSPAILFSPLPTFDPSPRLSVNLSQIWIPHLFPKSQRPKSNSSSTPYSRWPTAAAVAAAATGYSHHQRSPWHDGRP